MKTYPSMSLDFVLHDLPSLQGHALVAAALEMDSMLNIERATDGYLSQHRF